jgi:hypothetical protein
MVLLKDICKKNSRTVSGNPRRLAFTTLVWSVDATVSVELPLGKAPLRLDPWVSSVRTARKVIPRVTATASMVGSATGTRLPLINKTLYIRVREKDVTSVATSTSPRLRHCLTKSVIANHYQ